MHAELTHIPISPRTRNVLLALVVGLFLLLFWKAPTLPQLLITGMAVALVLSFPVRFLSRGFAGAPSRSCYRHSQNSAGEPSGGG